MRGQVLVERLLSQCPFPTWRMFGETDSWAQRPDLAGRAAGIPGRAAPTAMPNQPMAEHCPLRPWHQGHQFLLNSGRIRFPCEPEPL
jgi:hypothetical protein